MFAFRFRKKLLVSVLIAAAMGASPGLADGTNPPIRPFDIPTIELLGREMYAQDQEAWKATDILRKQHADTELQAAKMHGWIVETSGDHDTVRFLRDGADGPAPFYDVAFPKGGEPVLAAAPDSKLTAEEVAQFNARLLALMNVKRPCSARYNTVALKDPHGDGWIIWAMAATPDPAVIPIGGHYRFTISANGKSVRQADALSYGCLKLSKSAPGGGGLAAISASQRVSLTPVETHVFVNLTYKLPLYVGTADGKAWKIDQGHITTVEQDAPGADGVSARNFAAVDEICKSFVASTGEKDKKFFVGSEMHVIAATEKAAKFTLDVPSDKVGIAISCGRDEIVPAPNDYKVLFAGLSLDITDRGAGHPHRRAKLELADGKFQFRIIEGDALTADLQARVDARLAAFQKIAPPADKTSQGAAQKTP